MKKTRIFFTALIVLLMFGVFGCADDPDDPHDDPVGMVNPLIGVWKAGSEYWQFRTNGTGGKAASVAGSSSDNFSFFVYLESQFYASSSNKQQSLVLLDNSGNATRYLLAMTAPNRAVLTAPSEGGETITLEKVNGAPSALKLNNTLIGEYSATWYAANGTQSAGVWSIAYYADGTAKFYHNSAGHQFQNSYAVRGDKLVIYGNMRFGGLNATITPIVATISKQGDGTLKITETSGIYYVYTKVAAATWKPE
jgi:hypothetical protein